MEKHPTSVHDQPLDFFATALTILLCAIWSGTFVGIKISTLDMPPLGSGAVRFGLTSVVLLAWAYYRRVPLRCRWADLGTLAVTVALFFYINITTYVGTSWTTAGRATVFFYTQPIFLALLAPYFLPGDRLTPRKLCGLGLALICRQQSKHLALEKKRDSGARNCDARNSRPALKTGLLWVKRQT